MLKDILKEIKPTKEENKKVNEIINEILKKINSISKGKAILGGSGAKETWLAGTKEMDIFVKFKKDEDISKVLEKDLRKKFRVVKLHGSRDYFQIKDKGYTFEVIPVLDIKKVKDAKNITDISPFHALWVRKHKTYADDIRLTKQFAKAQGVYGAESYLKGFSGYVLEILTIYYKGFNNLIRNAAKWKDKVIIDPEKHLKNPLRELNKAKILSPLILVDPVDKTRNAAASLSIESFEKFKRACKQFLKNKNKKFFEIKEEKIPEDAIIIKFKKIKGKKDIVGAKIVKKLGFLVDRLNKEGFKVLKYGWKWDLYWFKIKYEKLSKFKEIKGPPLKLEKHVENFKRIHKKTYVKGNRVFSKIIRTFPDVKSFLKHLI